MRAALLTGIVGLSVLVGSVALLSPNATAQQANKAFNACAENPTASICRDRGSGVLSQRVTNGINVLLAVVAIASVITIVVGGLRYVLSMGDSAGITSAKNTILYAVIGLVVAMISYAIVNFVIGWF
jgi:hypothetical protein